jgi:hypothetical protein
LGSFNGTENGTDFSAVPKPFTLDRQEEPSQKVSLQLRVLRLGFLQDGYVGVGVFPESEEILVFSAALGGIALERVGACQAKVGQRTQREVHYDAAMVEKLLELSRCRLTLACQQVGLAAQIGWIQSSLLRRGCIIFNMYSDPGIRDGLGRLTNPLRHAQIDRIVVKQDGEEQTAIEKSEAEYFETEPLPEESADTPNGRRA